MANTSFLLALAADQETHRLCCVVKGREGEDFKAPYRYVLSVFQYLEQVTLKGLRCPSAGIDRNATFDELFVASGVIVMFV